MGYKIKILFCVLLFTLLLGCSSVKKEAHSLLTDYIRAYSTGNKTLLLSVTSKKLKHKLEANLSFFDTKRFLRIKSELKDFKIVITSLEKEKFKYRIYYYLVLNNKSKVTDRITMISENGKLKLFDTGMFIYS